MPARNRSGPQPDPRSARSEIRGFTLTALPSEGFKGRAPRFPIPNQSPRERAIWLEVWRTPQACAWASESWRWPVVAEYCRLKAIVEVETSASAALVGQLHRYRDQIGMTPAGLKENGWAIATDEISQRRTEHAADVADDPRSRLAPVSDVSADGA